jgi:hypothetical protein
VSAGGPSEYLALLASSAERNRAVDFGSTEVVPGVSRAVIQ